MERGDALRIAGDLLQPSVGNNITVPSGLGIAVGGNVVGTIGSDYGAFRGNVVQCRVTRYDTRVSLSTGTGVDGTEITGLRVSITPKFNNSMILCMFQMYCEGSHNTPLNVFKNGSVPTGTYSAFNSEAGNVAWSGIAIINYDNDVSTTPLAVIYYYHDFPGTTNTLTYAPGVKTSDGANNTVTINRAIAGTGQSGWENGVSFSMVWEIAQ